MTFGRHPGAGSDRSTLDAAGYEPLRSVPVRHTGQWVAAAVILVVAFALLAEVAGNEKLNYSIFFEFLTAESVLKGLLVTLQLTLISMAMGVVIGVLVAVARMSGNRVLQALGAAYVWYFRGVPLLVQILLWGNLAILFPTLGIAIPFTDISFVSVPTNLVLTTFVASILGLGLNEGAYMAEIVRGGILGVERGQFEAGTALGMTPGGIMRRIVLPQAFRLIIPPSANQLITLLKSSSLVSVIAGGELMTAVQNISSQNYRIIELLMVASFWYLVLVSVLSIFQRMLERRLSRGYQH